MNSLIVFATILAAAYGAPQTVVNTVNEGPQTGPLTPLVGNLVQTPKGLRPIDLEGFSEDLDQDGFVDPVVPAVPAPIVAPAPVVRTVAAPAPIAVPAPVVRTVAAPALTAQAPLFNAAPFAAPFATPFAAPFAAAPVFNAPVVRTVAAAPAPVVRTVVAAAPAPVVKTIQPLPIPVRAGPTARTWDVRRF